MGWISACGEFLGSAMTAFIRTKAKLNKEELLGSNDFCPDETKQFVSKSLGSCHPVTIDLIWWGRKVT